MDELNNNEDLREKLHEEDFSITDKFVGVLTEPSETFNKISKLPIKFSDWFVPVLLASIISLLAFYGMMQNETIKFDFEEKARIEIEKSINEQLDRGQITEENAEQGMGMGLKFAEIMVYVIKSIGTWFILFISALIYWVIIKFGFKDEGSYNSALVALGLPFYILVFQSIATLILAYLLKLYLNTPNASEILGMNPRVFPDFLLSFLDIFMIWYFIVVSIGLAKLFNSANTMKYYFLTFGIWIGLSLFFFAIS